MKRNRGCLITIITVLAAVALFVLAFVGFSWMTSSQIKKSGDAFLDESLPKIAKPWSVHEFRKACANKLKNETSVEDTEKMFRRLDERLGPLKTIENKQFLTMQAHQIAPGQKPGQEFIVAYRVKCQFEKKPATLELKLIFSEIGWRIADFVVNE